MSFFDHRAQSTSVHPGAEAFTAGPVDILATASAAAVRTTVPVPADVTSTAPDAEALTAQLLVCGEPECENQPCIAEPRQPTVLSHPLLPTWSVGAKTCNRFYHTRYKSIKKKGQVKNTPKNMYLPRVHAKVVRQLRHST